MSDENNETPDDPQHIEKIVYGNENVDLTDWLHEYVRLQAAERFSDLYDGTPKGLIPIVVSLTLEAMDVAEETSEKLDPTEPEPESEGDWPLG